MKDMVIVLFRMIEILHTDVWSALSSLFIFKISSKGGIQLNRCDNWFTLKRTLLKFKTAHHMKANIFTSTKLCVRLSGPDDKS